MNPLNIFLEHIYEACVQRDIPVERELTEAIEMGYTGLECDLWRLEDRERTKRLFDSCGMSVASVYAFYDFPHDSPDKSEQKILAHLETAAYFGADKVMAIPGFIQPGDDRGEVFQLCCEWLTVMCRRAREYGITVLVEDFDDINSPCRDISGLERLLTGTDGLRLTFDTGNFAYMREDAFEAYTRLKPYISHAHLKDRSRDVSRANADRSNAKPDISGAEMYPCETGSGYIGIEALLKKMIQDGYTGDFSVEHFGAVDQTKYMRKSAENVRNWISEVKKA
ncbi:MAG: sugar phosphate isomerase/epimerase family protein [Oscillospiraceae bacterium]